MAKTEKNDKIEEITLTASSNISSAPPVTVTVAPPENTTAPVSVPTVTVKEFDFYLGLSNEERQALKEELQRFNWMSVANREKLIKRLS